MNPEASSQHAMTPRMTREGVSRWVAALTLRRVTSPAAVLIGANVASNVLRLASTIVLTRLLSPTDFGLIAIIASLFSVIAMITDAGFQAFVVRHDKGDDPHFLDVIWTIHFARGIFNALIAACLALPAAMLLHKPALSSLLMVASLTIAIDGAASLGPLTALRRNLVRRLSLIDLAGQSVQLVVGVLMAWYLRDAWALVTAMIASSLVRMLASYLAFPESGRRPRFNRQLAAELWRFSRVVALSSLLTLAISQVDKLVLARVLTLDQFGVYAIAANLAAAPIAIAYQYSSRIFYPAIARTWRANPDQLKEVYYGLRGLLFYLYLFAGGLLIGSAPVIIRMLYDPRYVEAGLYLRLLAISTTLAIITDNLNSALTAVGRISTTLNANLVRIAWLLPGGVSAYLIYGPIGLITTLALIEIPAYLFMNLRLAALGVIDFKREILALVLVVVGVATGFLIQLTSDNVFPSGKSNIYSELTSNNAVLRRI